MRFSPWALALQILLTGTPKRSLEYGEKDALAEVKSWMEHQAYYLTEASVELAKERGRCKDSDKTRYGKGIFPWELRAKGVNELTDFTPDPALGLEYLAWQHASIRCAQCHIDGSGTCGV
jgi:hypothetical protein